MSGAGRSIRQTVSGARVGGDLTVIGQYNVTALEVSRREFRLAPFRVAGPRLPELAEARAQPSRLLDARLEVVGFTRRDRELAVLRAWRDLDDGAPVSAFLVDGAGGSGKTRLARQFTALSRADDWGTWEAYHDPAASLTPLPEVLTSRRQRGTLLVADYSERWPAAQLLALAQHLVTAGGRAPVRLLLLSRSAGDWWEVLSHRLNREGIAAQSRHLQPLSGGPRGAGRLFTAARDRFAEVLQVPGSDQLDVPDLTHDDFGLVLAVHMAALVAVDTRLRQPDTRLQPGVRLDPARLSAYLLRRERDAWHSLPAEAGQRPRASGKELGRMVYSAILTGPLPRRDAEQVLLTRTRLADTPRTAAQLLDDHRLLYPPRQPGTDLEPLYPDRLAEDFLALATPPASADDEVDASLADPWAADMPAALIMQGDGQNGVLARARPGTAVLIQAAARWAHLRVGYLYPLLQAHPELATAAGGAALATLAGFADLSDQVIDAIEESLPEGRDYELDLALAALTGRAAPGRLAAAAGPGDRAKLHVGFGRRYSSAGLNELALREHQQAASQYRALAEHDPERYRTGLADALQWLSSAYANLGRDGDLALALAGEAASLLRQADPGDDGYHSRLVPALLSLGDRLAQQQRRAEAQAVREEAIAAARVMTGAAGSADPGRTAQLEEARWDLATGLTSISGSLREAGQAAEALAAAEEGVVVARQLVTVNRNRYLGLLAWSLTGLGRALQATGQDAARVAVTSEAAGLYRLLARANPDVFLDSLAEALSSSGAAISQAGHMAEALDLTEESLVIRRDLARADPARYGLIYAAALCDQSGWLPEWGQNERAVSLAREAQSVLESVPGLAPQWRGMAMLTLARRLSRTAAVTEALAAAQTAVALYSEAVTGGETSSVLELADSYGTLSAVHQQLDQLAEAQAAAGEAIALLRPLAADGNLAARRALGWALHYLASALNQDPEHAAEAIARQQEAVEEFRAVAVPGDVDDQFSLSWRISELTGMLLSAGRGDEALPLTAEALEMARACLAARPGPERFRRLCWSLYQFGWTRYKTSQQLPAAAEVFSELAGLLGSYPGDRQLDLPKRGGVLGDLAEVLTGLGRQADATAARQEIRAEQTARSQLDQALGSARPVLRRLLTLAILSDPGRPRGAEALAVAAVTAPEHSLERSVALANLRQRLWREKHPGFRWLLGAPAADGEPDTAALLADVYAAAASDNTRSGRTRLRSARRLLRLGDPRGPGYLVTQAQDQKLGRRLRTAAARALIRAGDLRGQFLREDIRGSQDRLPAVRDSAWSLAVTSGAAPALRNLSPAAAEALAERRAAARITPVRPPGPAARIARSAAMLSLLIPVGYATVIGDALAQAPGSHLGPGNWAALCISACWLWAGLALLTRLFVIPVRALALGTDTKTIATAGLALLLLLLIAAGYLLADSVFEFLRPAGEQLWRLLIWRWQGLFHFPWSSR